MSRHYELDRFTTTENPAIFFVGKDGTWYAVNHSYANGAHKEWKIYSRKDTEEYDAGYSLPSESLNNREVTQRLKEITEETKGE